MILSTGQRTDIPAFFSTWLCNRLRAGSVCVRNPFNPRQVSRYKLDPAVVDAIGFCTKNPEPMLGHLDLLRDFGQLWYVTITPYGRDIEPHVPDKHHLLEVFRALSDAVGAHAVGWRYDPILITPTYSVAYHLRAFETMASALEGATDTVVISFVDRYRTVRRNFPEVREVSPRDRIELGRALIDIAGAHGMTVRPCAEGAELAPFGADCAGCQTIAQFERAIGCRLAAPAYRRNRASCACYLACDIGAYDTCPHGCRYCYANANRQAVEENLARHDPTSPLLIGALEAGDVVHDVPQRSWKTMQERLF